jgi:hypothetical protein
MAGVFSPGLFRHCLAALPKHLFRSLAAPEAALLRMEPVPCSILQLLFLCPDQMHLLNKLHDLIIVTSAHTRKRPVDVLRPNFHEDIPRLQIALSTA